MVTMLVHERTPNASWHQMCTANVYCHLLKIIFTITWLWKMLQSEAFWCCSVGKTSFVTLMKSTLSFSLSLGIICYMHHFNCLEKASRRAAPSFWKFSGVMLNVLEWNWIFLKMQLFRFQQVFRVAPDNFRHWNTICALPLLICHWSVWTQTRLIYIY